MGSINEKFASMVKVQNRVNTFRYTVLASIMNIREANYLLTSKYTKLLITGQGLMLRQLHHVDLVLPLFKCFDSTAFCLCLRY